MTADWTIWLLENYFKNSNVSTLDCTSFVVSADNCLMKMLSTEFEYPSVQGVLRNQKCVTFPCCLSLIYFAVSNGIFMSRNFRSSSRYSAKHFVPN